MHSLVYSLDIRGRTSGEPVKTNFYSDAGTFDILLIETDGREDEYDESESILDKGILKNHVAKFCLCSSLFGEICSQENRRTIAEDLFAGQQLSACSCADQTKRYKAQNPKL